MHFNSFCFILFLAIVLIFRLIIKNTNCKQYRIFISLFSTFFYAWNAPIFLLILLFIAYSSYQFGGKISKTKNLKKAKYYLFGNIVCSLSVLMYYKYLINILNSLSTDTIFGIDINILYVVVPIGISFYVFQSISYTVDLYRKRIDQCESFLNYYLYLSFFPQLIAGPIEKAERLIPQLQTKRKFLLEDGKTGIYFITYGIFQKVVVADNISLIVDKFYSNVNFYSINSSFTILAIFLYSIQIYCDFSGYSNIAIGVARLFGIKLSTNFKTPYFSRNIIEFWRRWHITLSFWFRDYLYIPLGGSRITKIITVRNLFLVFVLSGLWHGANSKFVVWGLLHFCFYIIYTEVFKGLNIYNLKILSSILTFIIVSFFWIPFRAVDLNDSLLIIKSLINFNFTTLPVGLIELFKIVLIIFVFIIFEILRKNIIKKSIIISIIWLLILFLGNYNNDTFIYFQF